MTPNKVNEVAKSPSTASAAAGSKGATPKLSMARLQAQLMEQVKQQSSPASAASKVSPFDSLRREILAHLHSAIFKVKMDKGSNGIELATPDVTGISKSYEWRLPKLNPFFLLHFGVDLCLLLDFFWHFQLLLGSKQVAITWIMDEIGKFEVALNEVIYLLGISYILFIGICRLFEYCSALKPAYSSDM